MLPRKCEVAAKRPALSAVVRCRYQMNCQRVGLIRTVRYLMERFRRVLARHRRLRHAFTPFMIDFFSRKLQIKDSARPLARTRIEWGALVLERG